MQTFAKQRKAAFYSAQSTGSSTGPMAQLNITPLIDVLLVLLVMMMLSIPALLHEVEIEIPSGGESTGTTVVHDLRLAASGAAIWNGNALSDFNLRKKLEATSRDPAKPRIRFESDGDVRYARFAEITAMIKRSKVRKIGFAGNHKFAQWDRKE